MAAHHLSGGSGALACCLQGPLGVWQRGFTGAAMIHDYPELRPNGWCNPRQLSSAQLRYKQTLGQLFLSTTTSILEYTNLLGTIREYELANLTSPSLAASGVVAPLLNVNSSSQSAPLAGRASSFVSSSTIIQG